MSLNALRGIADSSKPKTKKSSVPTIEVSPKIAKLIRSWVDAKRQNIEAEARMEECEGELLPFAEQTRIANSRNSGKLVKSVTLKDDNAAITVVQAAKFSKMDANESESILQKTFGENYSDYFRVKTSVSIKSDISDEVAKRLVDALTAEFGDLTSIIESTSVVEPTERLVNDMSLNEDIGNKVKDLQASHGLIKMAKPSVKLATK